MAIPSHLRLTLEVFSLGTYLLSTVFSLYRLRKPRQTFIVKLLNLTLFPDHMLDGIFRLVFIDYDGEDGIYLVYGLSVVEFLQLNLKGVIVGLGRVEAGLNVLAQVVPVLEVHPLLADQAH